MHIRFVPVLRTLRELYLQPRDRQRCQRYIATLLGGTNDVILPGRTIRPMARVPLSAAVKTRPGEAGRRAWTYADYLAIPEDGQRYEVIWGELHVAAAPSLPHQRVVLRLAGALDAYVRSQGLGEVFIAPIDLVLAPDLVLQPDIVFVARQRFGSGEALEASLTLAPDLVVEVLSPSTAAADRGAKRDAYATYGVPHYWLAGPRARTLETYVLRNDAYTLGDRLAGEARFAPTLFPGLEIALADLWA